VGHFPGVLNSSRAGNHGWRAIKKRVNSLAGIARPEPVRARWIASGPGRRPFFNMRNTLCPKYSRCLNATIRENATGFDCAGCKYERRKVVPQTDLIGEWLLLWALFKPDLYHRLREMQSHGHAI